VPGASGFLLKSAPPEELLYAIRSVHNGDSVVAPSTTRRLIGRFVPHLPVTGEPPPGLAGLTARERQVLAEVGSGLSNAEIAALLTISEATVKTHVGHIMTKLCLRDRIPGSGLRVRDRPGHPSGSRHPADAAVRPCTARAGGSSG
jgi:DNA-binding NarL/FixJ family response regulator